MSDDLARRIRNLRESRNLDDIDEDAYQRGLNKLRDRYGADAVNKLLQHSLSQSPPAPRAATVTGGQVGRNRSRYLDNP